MALESALGELRRLESALASSRAQERRGREHVTASARSGDVVDRIAGLTAAEAARRRALVLLPRIAAAESETAHRRQEFLSKRIERRQAETLIRESEALDAVQAGRRDQQALDDWFGARAHQRDAAAEPPPTVAPHRSTGKKL